MKTINLLPKKRQTELRFITVLHALFVIFFMSIATFVLVVAAQMATKMYLKNQIVVLENDIVKLRELIKKNENSQVKAQVKAANDLVSDYKNLVDLTPRWSKVIKAFVPLPPSGVKINSFAIDPQRKSININGFSPTRELVIQLYNNILDDKENFYDIDYPLENVAKPKEITFHFTFYIKDELLK